MINALIQALTLVSGLLVNFLVPGIYGLTAYGDFIKLNVLVFVFQKFFDIVNEQLLANLEEHYVFFASLVMGLLVLFAFISIDSVLPLGNIWLLAAMLWSSACLLALFALKLQKWIVGYLIYFLLFFLAVLALVRSGIWNVDVAGVLLATNLAGAMFATCVLLSKGAKIPPRAEFFHVARAALISLPKMVSVTLVFNVLTNILPYLLSRTLASADLGLFRVTTSLVQSAFSVFPINIRAIFLSFLNAIDRLLRFRMILGVAIAYFAVVGVVAEAGSWIIPQLRPYLVLLPCLPVLFAAALTERYLIATGRSSKVIIVNLFAIGLGIIYWINIDTAGLSPALIYAYGFSAYLLMLHGWANPGVSRVGILCLAIGAPLSIYYEPLFPGISLSYLLITIFSSIIFFKVRLADIKEMKVRR